MAKEVPTVSLNPADFVTGGLALDDADVEFKKCRVVDWDYGKQSLGLHTTALKIEMTDTSDDQEF